jgi:biopolymer transport protein ExbB
MDLAIEQVRLFVVMGGPVMAPLILVGVLLWYFLLSRGLILRRGVRGDIDTALEAALKGPGAPPGRGIIGSAVAQASGLFGGSREATRAELEVIVNGRRLETTRHARLIGTLVATAPLLGLLGTVGGMIETFESLTDMAMFSRTGGGISGGISEALTTTQMGLGIAIPGLLVARVLESRARRIRDELDRLVPLYAEIGTWTRRGEP